MQALRPYVLGKTESRGYRLKGGVDESNGKGNQNVQGKKKGDKRGRERKEIRFPMVVAMPWIS
jgi:hypothetical protein